MSTFVSVMFKQKVETTPATVNPYGDGVLRGTINGIPIYTWSPTFVITLSDWMISKKR